MQKLPSSEIPEDYHYYRSHSSAFFDYTLFCEWKNAVKIEEGREYGYIHHYLFGFFSIAYFEKCDISPTRELLAKYSMKRGIVFWSWWKHTRPNASWWMRLGYVFARLFHHSTRSAFAVLDIPDYWKKWSPNARWHRRKIHREIELWKITINIEASFEDFLDVYKKTKIYHPWKSYNIWRQKYLSKHHSEDIRIYTASLDWVVLAWAIFLDDAPTSTYLIAFQDDDAKRYHLGLALIDRWFLESQKLGYKYLDLDHMRDTLDPLSYAGYTRFKSEVADYEISFREVWMRVFL